MRSRLFATGNNCLGFTYLALEVQTIDERGSWMPGDLDEHTGAAKRPARVVRGPVEFVDMNALAFGQEQEPVSQSSYSYRVQARR